MVGTHTFIGKQSKKEIVQLDFLKHEPWFIIDRLYASENISMFMSYYDGYPYMVSKNDRWTIIVEGMIYNLSDEEVIYKCELIANKFLNNEDYLNEIKGFTDYYDGDFIIQVYDKKSGRYLVFNDYLGRLSLYYSTGNDFFNISREIKTHLEFASKIDVDLKSITEFLMLGFSLGNRTFFKNIHRLKAGQAIIIDDPNNFNNFKVLNICKISYKRKKNDLNKEKILNKLVDQFLLATKNRIHKLRENKYELISDLSGGFDSRALIGALSKYDKNIKYFTYEYIQDESIEARQIFNEVGAPGKYIKLKFDNLLDVDSITDLVYKTDGIVDYLTTSICYNDAVSLKKYLNNYTKIAHFGGFGGEFIRHPQKMFFKSVYYGIKNAFYSGQILDTVLSIFNPPSNIPNEIKNYFNIEYKGNAEEQLRKFYYEYYLYHVGHAGEERTRLFNWTVHPIWSKDFVKTTFEEVPLKMTGYNFFIDFMKKIDEKLLSVPIYKRYDLDMASQRSINDYEKKNRGHLRIKTKINHIIKYYLPFIESIYKRLTNKDSITKAEDENLYNTFIEYYNKLEKYKSIFNLEKIKENISGFGRQYNRLTTLVMYFGEIEKRYSDKIVEIKN